MSDSDTMKSYGPDLPAPIHGAAQSQQMNPALMRIIMYAMQAADAENSAQKIQGGAHETSPIMKPFSHGGFPTMAAGFGVSDLVRNILMRHASPQDKMKGDAAQAISSALGIMSSDQSAAAKANAKP